MKIERTVAMSDRSDLIVTYFDFLIKEYDFRIARKEFDPETMGNAVVVFKSLKFGIEITIDRNQVLLSIGEHLDSRLDWFELTDVLKYYAPNIDSNDVYFFPEKTQENTWEEIVTIQLGRMALLFRQNCGPVLKGEGWEKDKLREIEKERKAEMLKNFNQDFLN